MTSTFNLAIKSSCFFLLLLFLAASCTSQTCQSLPKTFSNYTEALSAVKSSKFKVFEELNTSSSSWIRGASYYSCDGVTGYFILKTDEKEYIHSGVPIGVWRRFKNAESFGSAYNKNFKGRYTLELR